VYRGDYRKKLLEGICQLENPRWRNTQA